MDKKRIFKEAAWKIPRGDSGKWIISAAQMTWKDAHTSGGKISIYM